MIFAPPLHVGTSISRRRPILLVEHVVRELDRVKGVLAPVDLGVLLRMRVLDGESIRARGVERRSIRVAQVRGEVRLRAGIRRVAAQAVHAIDGIVLQVVDTHPAALVGVRHRTSMLEPPLPRSGDGAVDPARTRGRSSHDAGVARIERVRDLDHHGDVDPPGAVVVVRHPFLARDHPGANGDPSIHGDVRAVQGGVATIERGIDERAVVDVDRAFPQLRCSRVRRVHESGRRRSRAHRRGLPQARRAETAGQQVVAAAVVHGAHDGCARDERGQRVVVGAGASSGDGEKREHDALRHGSSEAIGGAP